MRHNRRSASPLVAVILLACLAACAGAPVQEMSDARQAIHAAEEAGAAEHAPRLLSQARTFLASARQKVEKRAYNQARKDARNARDKAKEAREVAEQTRDGT